MTGLEEIQKLVDADISLSNNEMRELLFNEKRVVKGFVSHVLKSQGKQIRPLILFLTAKMYGEPSRKSHLAAALIELTHCASLIHDDIIDEAYQRRGFFSIYAIWRNKKSVLIGDYIFSRAIRCAAENQLYEILSKISDVIEQMSIGEIEQSDAATKLNITEQQYYDIIKGKTAALISSCAYSGAFTVGASEDDCKKMARLGEVIGMIFQIKDDILDYSKTDLIGKLSCNDIKEQKITLPLIIALTKSDPKKRKEILSLLRNVKNKRGAVEQIHSFVMQSGSMEYCYSVMREYADQSLQILDSCQQSQYNDALKSLVEYLIERKK